MAAPTSGPCGPWITSADVLACCAGLSDPPHEVQLQNAIDFATGILFRLSGRQYPGICSRTVRPCFPAGTLITTENGPVAIEAVTPGTKVLTHRGRWRRVLEGGQTGHASIIELRGQGARLRATADHGVWASEVFQSPWPERRMKLGAPEWRDAKDMIGCAWATPRDVEPLPVPLLEDGRQVDWWMVGRWLGDGWTAAPDKNPGRNASRVTICCGHHEADELAQHLPGWKRYDQRTGARFVLHDAPLRSWLRSNFGVGSGGKSIPGWVLGMPVDDRLALLAGYVSADGSRREEAGRDRVRCGTVSYPLAVSLRMLAVSLGYPAQVGPRKQRTTFIEGRPVNSRDWWAVEWLEGPTAMTWQDEGDGLLWGRVRSIVDDTLVQVPVYNITVEEDHSYVADGIIVKNCFGDGCGCGSPGWLQWPQGGWSYWVWDQAAAGWAFPSLPYRIDGEWWNLGSCCSGECALPSVLLPAPVGSVTEVVIDGEVLDPSAYAVEQHRRLVRLDGNDWPCTQDRRRQSGAYANDDPPSINDGSRDGTWQVTYSYGRVPDQSGLTAVSRFACEVAKFLCNADDCVLPQRLRTIVREGVSMDFADPLVFLDEGGRVGIYEVDLWLNSVNPGKLARRSTVRRLDAPPQYRGFT